MTVFVCMCMDDLISWGVVSLPEGRSWGLC